MKKNEFKQLKNLTVNELQKMLLEKREKLRNLRFDLNAGKIKNFSEIKKTKKDIAQILTLINQKKQNKENE
jgi:large subunit ribosomal protein L29